MEVEGKISSGKDDEQGAGNLHCMQHNSLDSLRSRACKLLKMMICKGADGGGLDRNITFKAYAQDGLQTKASSKAELSPSTEASITPVSPPFKTRARNDGGVVPGTPLTAPTPEAATQDAFTPVPGTVKSKIHAFTTLARPDSPRPLQTVTPVPTQSAAIDPGSDGEARVVYMPATGNRFMADARATYALSASVESLRVSNARCAPTYQQQPLEMRRLREDPPRSTMSLVSVLTAQVMCHSILRCNVQGLEMPDIPAVPYMCARCVLFMLRFCGVGQTPPVSRLRRFQRLSPQQKLPLPFLR